MPFPRGSGSGDRHVDAGDPRRCRGPWLSVPACSLARPGVPDTAERDHLVRACPYTSVPIRMSAHRGPGCARRCRARHEPRPVVVATAASGLGEVVPMWRPVAACRSGFAAQTSASSVYADPHQPRHHRYQATSAITLGDLGQVLAAVELVTENDTVSCDLVLARERVMGATAGFENR
jgi:hypothetical protein